MMGPTYQMDNGTNIPSPWFEMLSYDTKPKRRLFELIKSQGLQANQQVTFLSDGADDVGSCR
jgi:hypothetical protein